MTGNNLICIRDVPARPILRLRQRLNGADAGTPFKEGVGGHGASSAVTAGWISALPKTG
jgi:hypothetical protein